MSTRLRKSSRIQKKVSEYKETQEESDFADSGSEYSDVEEEPVPTSNKRSKKQAPAKTTTKRRKAGSNSVENFEENDLYRALSRPDISVLDVTLDWIELYIEDETSNKTESFSQLFNLLLRCCGCNSLVQPHDLVNLELTADTIAEISVMFEKQKYHEYPFISNNKNLKFFRKNVVEFFEKLIDMAHERGILYKLKDDVDEESSLASPFMNQILAWFTSLSSCRIRPFRYVATVATLTMQTTLCHVLMSVTLALEKQQRNLNNSKGSKRANQKKIDTITETVELYHKQKETILQYSTDITEAIFIHRYRDVDPLIRQECLKSLGQWMLIYPDHFFQSSFLRYFGWLLSDPDDHVRAEVSRSLLKLYKHANSSSENMNMGFRQFTERFKNQFINMSWKDTEITIRLNLCSILRELLVTGFLDEEDVLDVSLNIFQLIEFGSGSGVSNDDKLKVELCKFISLANSQATNRELEKFTLFIKNYESPQFGDDPTKLNLEHCLKIKNLITILQSSQKIYVNNKSKRIVTNFQQPKKVFSPISVIFKTLYSLPLYSGLWEFLIRYLLYDLSSINFVSKDETVEDENVEVDEFKQLLELSGNSDTLNLLEFILGAISSINDKKKSKKTDEEDMDDTSNALVKLVNYLPSLVNLLIKSTSEFHVFLQLWNVLISSQDDNIATVYSTLGQSAEYEAITDKILTFFQSIDAKKAINANLIQSFDGFFERLVSNYHNSSLGLATDDNQIVSSIMDNEIRLKVQNLLNALIAHVRQAFNSTKSNDSSILNELTNDDELEEQKNVCNILIESASPLLKLNKLGNFININDFFSTSGSVSILELLNIRVISKLDIRYLADKWQHNFLKFSDEVINAFKASLDLILVSTCWKLDNLIYVPSSSEDNIQSQYDMESIFDDVGGIIRELTKLLKRFDDAISFTSESLFSSSPDVRNTTKTLLSKFNTLKTVLVSKFIDLVVSLRIFYVKFRDNNSFKNFDSFFTDIDGIWNYIGREIPLDVANSILSIFLIKEAKLASLISVKLERADNEGVNYDDIIDDTTEEVDSIEVDIPERSGFDSDSDLSDEEDANRSLGTQQKLQQLQLRAKKQQNIWNAEKELCVLTVKLFSLINTGLVSDSLVQRLKLNGERIGGLYFNILKQNEPKDNETPTSPDNQTNLATTERDNTPSTAPTLAEETDILDKMTGQDPSILNETNEDQNILDVTSGTAIDL